nr:winged helix-turn-helix domain-containing protein [Burkholderia cenocepacia]
MIQIGTLSVDFEQRDIRRHGASLRIGARALDILEVLHRASGSVVSKDDIMDAVWPGLIVEENRLQVHVATLRKALGASRDLIKTVPGRGYLLVASASPGPDLVPAAEAPAVSVPSAVAALPDACASSLLAPLVGRDAEIAQIVDMLERTPVITLVGAGGIGKTSLAVRVAHGVRSRAHERVLFVELARASTRDDMLIALAAELGLDTSGVPAIDRIGDAFATSRCLLVLDNAEHIVDLVASLVETLTSSAGSLRVLVTSREPLHISAEAVLRMSPLAVPDGNASAAEIVRCSAVELFLERVRAAAPDCAVDEAGVRLIGDICRRLDGLPLAIELAAARVATLGLAVVASRLDDRLNLLTGGLRSALPRHQTLRATFDWSYVLLDRAARALFRRMGCFIGPFSFDAARAVATEPGTSAADMIAVLGELVAKSLVTVEFDGAYARYRLTESTRAYALEKLHNEGEFERIVARHAEYERERAHARPAAPVMLADVQPADAPAPAVDEPADAAEAAGVPEPDRLARAAGAVADARVHGAGAPGTRRAGHGRHGPGRRRARDAAAGGLRVGAAAYRRRRTGRRRDVGPYARSRHAHRRRCVRRARAGRAVEHDADAVGHSRIAALRDALRAGGRAARRPVAAVAGQHDGRDVAALLRRACAGARAAGSGDGRAGRRGRTAVRAGRTGRRHGDAGAHDADPSALDAGRAGTRDARRRASGRACEER